MSCRANVPLCDYVTVRLYDFTVTDDDSLLAFQAVDDGDEDVVDTTGLGLFDDFQPEFDAFGLLDPRAENFLLA